jgi:hypothetical protein
VDAAGVGYLAGKWALHVAQQQQREGAQLHPPHTMLTPLDIELIELAGAARRMTHAALLANKSHICDPGQ